MANSLPNVTVKSKVWVDLYAATGIAVGTKIIIQNLGANECRLVEYNTEPTKRDGYNEILVGKYLSSADVPVGAWAYAHSGTTLHVEEA